MRNTYRPSPEEVAEVKKLFPHLTEYGAKQHIRNKRRVMQLIRNGKSGK